MDTTTTTFHLKKMPDDINKILRKKQGELLIKKGVLLSKEKVIYIIIKEWNGEKEREAWK